MRYHDQTKVVKRRALLLRGLVAFAVLLCGLFSSTRAANATVTIHGNVKLWRPDLNAYEPMKRIRVRIVLAEDYDYDTGDVEASCDDNGYYVTTKGNAWWRSGYKAYAIAFAEVSNRLEIQNSYPQIDGYQASTGKIFAKDSKTTRLDVYVGGPQSNVGYAVGGMALLDNADSTNATLGWRAFYLCNVGTDHRLRASNMGFSEFEEKEVVFPENSDPVASSQPFWDYIRVPSSNFDDAGSLPGLTRVSKTMRHELGHGMMSDTYYTWPGIFHFGSAGSHSLDKVADEREYAWSEAWAEFIGQATQQQAFGATTADLETLDSGWHDKVIKAGGDASFIEGEIAASLWDVYDGVGSEKCLKQNPDVPGDEMFVDRISDGIGKIRAIFEDKRPHSFTHESFFGSDSFVWYWVHDKKYGQPHELKTILFNRGIRVNEISQSAPQLKMGKVSWQNFDVQIPVTVTENDAEDRPFVRVDVFANDAKLDSRVLATGWNGATNSQTIAFKYALKKGAAAPKFTVAVSDEMDTVSGASTVTPPANAYINGVKINFVRLVVPPPQDQNGSMKMVSDLRVKLTASNGKSAPGVLDIPGADYKSPPGSDGIQFVSTSPTYPYEYTKSATLFQTLDTSQPVNIAVDLRASVWTKWLGGEKVPFDGQFTIGLLNSANGFDIGEHTAAVRVSKEVGPIFLKESLTLSVYVTYEVVPVVDKPFNFVTLFPTFKPWLFLPKSSEVNAPPEPAPDTPQKAPKTTDGAVSRSKALLKSVARLQAEVVEINNELEWKMSAKGLARDGMKTTSIPSSIQISQMKAPQAFGLGFNQVASIAPNARLLELKMPAFLQSAMKGKELPQTLSATARENLQALDTRSLQLNGRMEELVKQAATLRARLSVTTKPARGIQLSRANVRGTTSPETVTESPAQKAALASLDLVSSAATQLRPILTSQRLAIAQGLKLGDKPIFIAPFKNPPVIVVPPRSETPATTPTPQPNGRPNRPLPRPNLRLPTS